MPYLTMEHLEHRQASPSSRVTAVVLNYNGRRLLEVVLPSLAAQTYQPLDVLVVDDCSGDDSRDYLARTWPDVRVLALSENVGVAAAINRGLDAAGGDYVALLNNDLELEPSWIAEMVAGLERHPQAAAVACKLLDYRHRDRIDAVGDGVTRSITAYSRGRGQVDRGQFDHEQEILAATAGAAMYRATALAEVGPFDESFTAYYEDVDWSLRAQLAGLCCWYVPTAVGYHMGGATTGGSASPTVHMLLIRNVLGVIVKDLPLSLILRNAPGIAREQAGSLVHSARHGRLGLHLYALAAAACRAPGWLIARHRIQRARRIPPGRLAALLTDRPGKV